MTGGCVCSLVGWHVLGAPDGSWERLGNAPGISTVNRKWKNRSAFSWARIKPFENLHNKEHLMRVTVGCHTFVLPTHVMREHLSSEANAYWSTLSYILLINRHQCQRGNPEFNTLEGICCHQTQLDPLSESEKKKTVDSAYFSLPLYFSGTEGILKDFNSSITCNLCMAFLSYSLHIFRWLRDYWRRFVSSPFTRVATFIFEYLPYLAVIYSSSRICRRTTSRCYSGLHSWSF